MSDSKYTALVLGASGLIGKETLNLLLKNNKYKTIYAVSRKPLGIIHPKLVQIIADLNSIEASIKDLSVDHFFSCIGTTANKTPDKNQYYAIDLNYPLSVATLLHKNDCQTCSVVSSIGANSTSNNFYLRLKGDVEKVFQQVGFKSLHILRPSLLLGVRKEFRLLEKIGQVIYPAIDFLLVGKMKDYRSIQAVDIASTMINVSITNKQGIHIYQTQLIKELA